MNYTQVILLGAIEGLTEFLPVSSTAHLIIVSRFLNLPQTEFQKFFEVFIQSGAILAVIFLYFQYFIKNREVIKKIGLSFIPTAIIGLIFYKTIKNIFFESSVLIVITLLIVGVIFILVESLIKNKKLKLEKTINHLTISHSLLIGLGQSLAIIPGVSRAGIVMVVMMILGYKRDESAKYSFLLAVPTILAASGLDLIKTMQTVSLSINELIPLIIGFFVSMLTAYIVIKWFINFLQKNSLVIFGIYRIVIAIILMKVIFY